MSFAETQQILWKHRPIEAQTAFSWTMSEPSQLSRRMVSVAIDNESLYEHAVCVAAKMLGLRVDRDRRAVVFIKPLLNHILGLERERHEMIIYGAADPVKQGVYNYLNKQGFNVKTNRRNFTTGKQEGCMEAMACDIRRIAAESVSMPGLESIVILSGDSRLMQVLPDVVENSDLDVEICGFAGTIASQLYGLMDVYPSRVRISTLADEMIYKYFGFDTLYEPHRGGRMRRDLTFVVTIRRVVSGSNGKNGGADDALVQFSQAYAATSHKYKDSKRAQSPGSGKKPAGSALSDDERDTVRETLTNMIGLTVKLPTRSNWNRDDRNQLHVVVSGPADGVELTSVLPGGDIRTFEKVIRGFFIEEYSHLDMRMETLCQVQAGPMPASAVLQKILNTADDQSKSATTTTEETSVNKDWVTVIAAEKHKHKARTAEVCTFGFGCRYGVKCFYSHTKKQCEYFEMHGKGFRYYKVNNCVKVNCEYLGRMHLCPYKHKGEQL